LTISSGRGGKESRSRFRAKESPVSEHGGVTVDDVVEAIFRRLCDRQRAHGVGADMSLAELRLALGATEAQLMEAVKVLRLSDDLRIAFTAQGRDRVTLGASWRGQCEDPGVAGA